MDAHKNMNAHKKRPSKSPVNGENARRQWQHFTELARAEAVKGDPIAAENYYQHAEHYWRMADEARQGH